MSWAITGASGQLGRSLIDLLEETGTPFISWSKEDLDISKKDSIEKVIKARPKVLVNCAAYTAVDKAESEPEIAESVNCLGAEHMAAAARELKIPFIHVSTDYVFSGSKKSPWLVNDETGPLSVYGISKLNGENAVLKLYREGTYILRTAWLYSQYGENIAKKVLRKALSNNAQLRMVHDQKGQPTSTIDLAAQIYAVINHRPEPGVFHAANSGEGSWFDFAKELYRLAGISESLISPILTEEYKTPAKRPAYSALDVSKWQTVGMAPMQEWRSALNKTFPNILKKVKEELANG